MSAKTWKDVLHSQEKSQKECIDHASDIVFACSDIIRLDFGTALIENYVHTNVYVLVAFHEIQ